MKLFTDSIAFISEIERGSPPFQPIADSTFIILVGLTGVGKSTAIDLLQTGFNFILLPDRRKITNEIIITSLQQEDGEATSPVTDRVKRFEYTARYRAKHPGGMAHALSQLAIDPSKIDLPLIFDGLRGLNEVQHATDYFPEARFVILDAPDIVRLTRLLKRGDTFDTTRLPTSLAGQNMIAGLLSIPDIEAIFTTEQLRQISRAARAARLSIDDVVKKASIIVEERRNYDSSAARVYLARTLTRQKVLVINTDTQPPQEVADRIKAWFLSEG